MKYQIYYCNTNTKDKTKKIKSLYTKKCSHCARKFNTPNSFKTCKKCRNYVLEYKQAHQGYYIYTVALKSDLDKILYVGSTTYLNSRVSAHKCEKVDGTKSIFKNNPLSDIVIKAYDVSSFINNTKDLVNLEYFTMWYYKRPVNNVEYKDDFCYDYDNNCFNQKQIDQVNYFLTMVCNKEFSIWNWRDC